MRSRNWYAALAVVASLTLVAAACGNDDDSTTSSDKTEQADTSTAKAQQAVAKDTIVDVASADPQFSTLVQAVTAADLVETLSGDGPFTVFAPTNDAFAKIPADQLNAILADKEQLSAILTYHVLPAKVLSTQLQPTQMVTTVEGQDLDITVADGKATVNGCAIIKTDIEASNGVIHVIDCVLTPPEG